MPFEGLQDPQHWANLTEEQREENQRRCDQAREWAKHVVPCPACGGLIHSYNLIENAAGEVTHCLSCQPRTSNI